MGVRYSREVSIKRFLSKIVQVGDCHLWQGGKDKDGYGLFWLDGKNVRAHRLAWELCHGAVPDGKLVCHNCPTGDDPRCCNTAHMFLGTVADNARDMVQKGRSLSGQRNPKNKLTPEQVEIIRKRRASGETQTALAKEFGVIQAHISRIVNRAAWKTAA